MRALAFVALAVSIAACGPQDPRKTQQPAAPEGFTLTAEDTPVVAPAPTPKGEVTSPAATAPPVELVARRSAESPLVAFRLVYRVGALDDPPGREGLAALTARVIAKGGAGERDYSAVLSALYPMAASVGVQVDEEVTVFYGTVHRDNLDAYADLLATQVLAPRLSAEDFSRERRAALDHIVKTLRGDNDEELGKHALSNLLFEGRPYAHPVGGTEEGLRAITLADVEAFYKSHLRQRGELIVGLAGGYPEGFAGRFAGRFAALEPGPVQRPALPLMAPPEEAGLDILLVDKPGRAAALSLGHPLPLTRADDDFYPLLIAASYLGEHRTFNGVLMNELRGKRGLNYGDYAYIETFIQDGWSTFARPNTYRQQQQFEIWIRPVAPANTLFSLRAALYETDKLVREGIPEKGFEDTRAFLLAYSKLWVQSLSRRLGYAVDAELFGRDLLAELSARLPKLTKGDVDAALRKWIHPDRLSVAIVTPDAEGVAAALSSGAPTPIVYDTKGTPDDVLAVDKLIEAFPLKARRVRRVPSSKMFTTPALPVAE